MIAETYHDYKIEHTSYTDENGYVWRKRCQSGMISISIKTREPQEALQRATRMHLRFLELEKAQLNRAEIQGLNPFP